MSVSTLDWIVVALYFLVSLAIGLYFSKRASKDTSEFFGAGRSLTWWLAGTSMVATTFSSDTPLAVTELVYEKGVAGNWLWWNFVFSGMLTVFFFARMWRRVGVLTDVEFAELRYGGKPAAVLRGFRSLYFGIVINSIIMGWVVSAIGTIISIALGMDRWLAIGVCLCITVLYSMLSGLWGVVITDFFQFIIAMGGCIALAVFGVAEVGGIDGMKARLAVKAGEGAGVDNFLSVIPPVGSAWLPVILFFSYIAVQWWASWYPGAEPGGGGYVAQRMFSAKNEKHSLLATLWFNVAHYGLRPWPWILTALVAVAIFPRLSAKTGGGYEIVDPKPGMTVVRDAGDHKILAEESAEGYRIFRQDGAGEPLFVRTMVSPRESYVVLMMTFLPSGLVGLMIAAMAAAFMSTIATHINWGCSYVVKDFYERFVKPGASEKHYINVSRAVSLVLMVTGGTIGYIMQSQTGGWELLLNIGAGTGLVLILRWFWWRVNAWSEISSMIAALVVSLSLKAMNLTWPAGAGFAYELLITVSFTTLTWIVATFATRPESDETLEKFYRKARPAGPGWKAVRARLGADAQSHDDLFWSFLDWVAGCVLIYTALFGIGKVLLKNYAPGVGLLVVAASAAGFIYWDLNRRGWKTIAE